VRFYGALAPDFMVFK